jgi:hypothetical protein
MTEQSASAGASRTTGSTSAYASSRESGACARVKDALSRELLAELDAAGIPLASTTFELTGIPPLRLKVEPGSGTRTAEGG